MKLIALVALLVSSQVFAYPGLNLKCNDGAQVEITYFEHGVSVAQISTPQGPMQVWNSDYTMDVVGRTYRLDILMNNDLGINQLTCVEAPRVETPSDLPYGGHYQGTPY